MSMKIEVEGGDAIENALQKIAGPSTKNLIADAAATELQSLSERNFRSERNRPEPWPDFAESTKKHMSKKRAKSPKLLIDHGTLLRSLSVESVSDGAYLVSAVDYADYHQYGTIKMPARPFVPVTGEYGGTATPTAEAEKRMIRVSEEVMKSEFGNLLS